MKKTAYGMRISDCSSDLCSSDLEQKRRCLIAPFNWIEVSEKIFRACPVRLHRDDRACPANGLGCRPHQTCLARARIPSQDHKVTGAKQRQKVTKLGL